MANNAMAFFFTIRYDNGDEQQYWSKPYHMALWERRNKGKSFLPAEGMPSMDSMFWLAFKAGRDADLFQDKLMDDWAARIVSFQFRDDDSPEDSEDEASEMGTLDPTRTAD